MILLQAPGGDITRTWDLEDVPSDAYTGEWQLGRALRALCELPLPKRWMVEGSLVFLHCNFNFAKHRGHIGRIFAMGPGGRKGQHASGCGALCTNCTEEPRQMAMARYMARTISWRPALHPALHCIPRCSIAGRVAWPLTQLPAPTHPPHARAQHARTPHHTTPPTHTHPLVLPAGEPLASTITMRIRWIPFK